MARPFSKKPKRLPTPYGLSKCEFVNFPETIGQISDLLERKVVDGKRGDETEKPLPELRWALDLLGRHSGLGKQLDDRNAARAWADRFSLTAKQDVLSF